MVGVGGDEQKGGRLSPTPLEFSRSLAKSMKGAKARIAVLYSERGQCLGCPSLNPNCSSHSRKSPGNIHPSPPKLRSPSRPYQRRRSSGTGLSPSSSRHRLRPILPTPPLTRGPPCTRASCAPRESSGTTCSWTPPTNCPPTRRHPC